jgi:hypothetical protein
LNEMAPRLIKSLRHISLHAPTQTTAEAQ